MFGLVIDMPLFEWQISEIVTDHPNDVRYNSLPWITKLGDSLADVSRCGNSINPEKLNPVVKRSWSEEAIERIARNITRDIFPWLWLLLFLCVIYTGWYAIYHKRSIAEAFIFAVVAMIFLCILLDSTRHFYAYTLDSRCLEGIATFNAKLSKIHYETLLVLFATILAEVVAVGMMLRQVVKAIMQRKETSKSAVG